MKHIPIRLADARGEPPVERDATVEEGVTIAAFLASLSPSAQGCPCGVWGKRVAEDYLLRAGDRVEIYRPLQADPKEARRRRARTAAR